MSNRLKKDLSNAKARLKAAFKKLEKLESSGDNQAIAIAQSKVDLEQEMIDDLEKRLQSETNNVTAIVRNEDGSPNEVTNTAINDAVAEDSETSNQTSENNAPSNSKKRKNDLPQVSFRTEEEIYKRLKQHYKRPTSSHLTPFYNIADMTRTLNLADLDGDLFFIIKRTNQQLARFLEVAETENTSNLPASELFMLKTQFFAYNANTDEEKAKLIEKIKSIYEHIEAVNLYEF